MTTSEETLSFTGAEFDDGISSAYASIRTYSNYSEAWCLWTDNNSTPREAQARLPMFSQLRPSSRGDFAFARRHLLQGILTLKLMQSISVDQNPDFAITSALWLPVQAYFAVHGFGMALLAAKDGSSSLPRTHGAFMRTAGQSIVGTIFPSPFSAALREGYQGFQYLQPKLVNMEDNRENAGSGFNLQSLNSTTREAHIAQCLNTTRRRLIEEKLEKERERVREKGKRHGVLRKVRQVEIAQSVAPTTVLDYLYRTRIKSNYEDPTMFSEQSDAAAALLTLVRNTQRLTTMLCGFITEALWQAIDESNKNRLLDIRVFEQLRPDLNDAMDGNY